MPSSWPSRRRSRSISASSKPSVVSTSACRRRSAVSVSSSTRPRDQQAVALVAASPDPAAQLVQLREPEAIGLLHDHDRRVRNVDADLDHGRRDEHVELVLLELPHHLAALGGLQLAVQETDAIAAQLRAPQPLGLRLGGAREPRLRQLDQRADDVGLPARVEMDAQPRVRLAGALGADARGDDRLAVRRRLGDLAHREVAVDRQRERARDRRRGHVQHVRRAILGERRALLDAEPVLLVDDGDGEIGELDVALDQRVRADGDLRDAVRDLVADLLRADRAGEQHAANAELRAERLEGQEVLLGERLGRRHQRALPARLHRPQQRVERDHGLAGADVALQEPLHRRRLRQVEVDLGDRPLLVLGQLERQHGRGSGRSARPAGRATARRRRCRAAARRSAAASRARRARAACAPARPAPRRRGSGSQRARRGEAPARARPAAGRESCVRVARARCARARATASTGSARWPDRRARSRPSVRASPMS